MSNCKKHKKKIAGISMKKLARMLSDLHYESLQELLTHLSRNIDEDAKLDNEAGRVKLAGALQYLGMSLFESSLRAEKVWKICKPHMKEEKIDKECTHEHNKYYQDRRVCLKCGYTLYGDTGER